MKGLIDFPSNLLMNTDCYLVDMWQHCKHAIQIYVYIIYLYDKAIYNISSQETLDN